MHQVTVPVPLNWPGCKPVPSKYKNKDWPNGERGDNFLLSFLFRFLETCRYAVGDKYNYSVVIEGMSRFHKQQVC